MNDAGTSRGAKRDVIDISDDEAKSEQPPEKILKKEAEPVLPEVAQPQHELLHPTNILQSCDARETGTVTYFGYFGARRSLNFPLSECDMESLLALFSNEVFDCPDCGANNLDAIQVFVHFLSTEHAEKMTDRSISFAAMIYWKEKLIQAESRGGPIHNVSNPINVFQLCRSDALSSVTIVRAQQMLQRFRKNRGGGISEYVKAMAPNRLYCEVCKTSVIMPGGIKHLFNETHVKEAAATGADRISLTAVEFWRHLFRPRQEDVVALKNDRKMKNREKRRAKKPAKKAAAAAQKKAEEAVTAAITAAALAAANRVAMELRSAAQNRLVQPEPAAAAASVEVKKEIVKVEND